MDQSNSLKANTFHQFFKTIIWPFLVVFITWTSAEAVESLPENILTVHDDHLDGILKRRQIRALVSWSKTDYFIVNGQQHGIAYEVSRDLEVFLNKTLKLKKNPITIVIVPVPRDKLITYLEQGRGDIALAELTITPERKSIDFSTPIDNSVQEVVIHHKSVSSINTLEDFAGKTFYLRPSSSYNTTLQHINHTLQAKGFKAINIIPLSENLADSDIMEMVNAGLINYTVLDDYRAHLWISIFPHIAMDAHFPLTDPRPIAFGLRKNTPQLKKLVDQFMISHRFGTSYGNSLEKRYFVNNPWARNALLPSELKRFNNMVEIFKKYSSIYNFDYLMMTAQGYQESGLNQNQRSRVGAIGVMQLMPSTGKSMKVGDIRTLESNIHAGVKYMNQLSLNYFNDPEIDAENRTLLCFAAYNAGPGRVAQMRRIAKERGLNPNLWFDNVETVAAEKIGHETVQYVLNISKYYVAYKMVEEQQKKRETDKKLLQKEDTSPRSH